VVVILKNIKKIIKVLRNKNISKIIQRKIHKNKKELQWNKMKKLKRKIKRKKRNQNDLNNQIFKKKLNIIIILN